MTTKNSPIKVLRIQAKTIAFNIKQLLNSDSPRINEAREKGELVIGIAMDDKFLKLTIPWNTAVKFSTWALAEFVENQMRELKPN